MFVPLQTNTHNGIKVGVGVFTALKPSSSIIRDDIRSTKLQKIITVVKFDRLKLIHIQAETLNAVILEHGRSPIFKTS